MGYYNIFKERTFAAELTIKKIIMKKTLLFTSALLVSILFLGCNKNEDTTYQIFNNVTKINSGVPYLDGTLYEVIVYEYNDNSTLLTQVEFDKISVKEKTRVITANGRTKKIKVSFKFLPKASPNYNTPENNRKITSAYFNLQYRKFYVAEMNDETWISDDSKTSNNNEDKKTMHTFMQNFLKNR